MATLAQAAFAEGFAALAGVHGNSWAFGSASFAGVASALKPDDPRMEGSPDRLIELIVRTSSLPAVPPKRGQEIRRQSDGAWHRITRQPDADDSTGFTTFILVRA